MKRVLIPLILSLSSLLPGRAQGLEFRSMNHAIDERTTYEVFAQRHPRFNDRLEISFDLKTLPISRYGYIFRLSNADDPDHIWNLSFDGRTGTIAIRLNDEGIRSAIFAEIPEKDLPYHQWTHIDVCLDAAADSVWCRIGGRSYGQALDFRVKSFRPSLFFGQSGHVVELPSFAIRDLTLSDGLSTLRFPLDEKTGTKVHDEGGRAFGRVINPVWLAGDAMQWKHAATLSSDTPGGCYYDPERHEVGLYSSRGLQKYSLNTERTATQPYASPCPIRILSGTSFWKEGRLYAYELSDWVDGPGKASVAELDLNTLEWTPLSTDRLDGPMHHHGAFLNPVTGEGSFFGGYGDMYFNGDFYAFGADGHWRREEVDRTQDPGLFPRFFCSAGVAPDSTCAYIFGGLGNETGEEVVGRRYFYDLHRYDLRTGECRHLWTIDWPYESSIPARGLVVRDDCFYALCYPEHLTRTTMYLYRFSLADGSCQRLASGIEANSDKIWCSSSLFYDASLDKLVAIANDVGGDLTPRADIYTLSFPPMQAPAEKSASAPWILIAVAAAAVLLGVLARSLGKRRRKKQDLQQEHDRYVLSQSDPRKRIYRAETRPNSISLFGPFTVTDRNGDNVTERFSQQSRTLLLLLIRAEEKGVSSSRISGILWPDKESFKARNSRGVAISNLRKALDALDGIALDYEGGVYKARVSEPLHMDYYDFRRCIDAGAADEALNLLSRGRFLKDLPNHIFDAFKSDVEALVVPFLAEEMDGKMAEGKRLATLEISDIALEYDPQDELALRRSVAALNALGRREDALVRYSLFQANWQRLNGEAYPVKFDEL